MQQPSWVNPEATYDRGYDWIAAELDRRRAALEAQSLPAEPSPVPEQPAQPSPTLVSPEPAPQPEPSPELPALQPSLAPKQPAVRKLTEADLPHL